jgi:hypothetical protein
VTAIRVRGSIDGVGLKEGITYFVVNVVIPTLTSTLNPVIYIILTPKFSVRRSRTIRLPDQNAMEIAEV